MNPGFSGSLPQSGMEITFSTVELSDCAWQMDDIFLSENLTVRNKLRYKSSLISGDFQCAAAVGTRTICQHCMGIIGASKQGAQFSHNRLWNAAMHTFLVHNDGE